MNRLQLIAFALLPGCFCWPFEKAEEPSVFQEEYLPYRQPNRDPNYPAMVLLRDEGDGTYFEMMRSDRSSFGGKEFVWGKRYKVEITSRYNRVTQYSDRSITALLEDSEAISGEFRLHSISAPYFKEGRRAFIDGKAFLCTTEDVCKALDAALDGRQRFDMVMGFGKTSDEPLQLHAVDSPTCYTTMDCTIRQECCAVGNVNVCVADDACPDEKKVGVVRSPKQPIGQDAPVK